MYLSVIFARGILNCREFVLVVYDKFKLSRYIFDEVEHRDACMASKRIYRAMIKQEKMLACENYFKKVHSKCKAAWNVIKS